jgi:serine/threonine protein kinase
MGEWMTLLRPDNIGSYRIGRLIGQGGMGAVYEAVHVGLKKRFAIKTLLPSLIEVPGARERFLREGEAASRINHPNVVTVSDVGTDNATNTPYLVMEFLEGWSLAEFLSDRHCVDISQALDILLPVISAISVGHAQGVIHRDLKPQNIFLARGPRGTLVPKVLDFGVSKITGATTTNLTGTLAILGTVSYMSPEQSRGAREVDGKSDQYALGLILYEMLTGVRAHVGENQLELLHNIINLPIVQPRDHQPDIPEALQAIVMRMLQSAAELRYPSLDMVGQALMTFAGSNTSLALRGTFGATSEASPSDFTPVSATQGIDHPPPIDLRRIAQTRLLTHASENTDSTLGRAASQSEKRREYSQRGSLGRVIAAAGVVTLLGTVALATFWMRSRTNPLNPSPIARRSPGPAAPSAPFEAVPLEAPAAEPVAVPLSAQSSERVAQETESPVKFGPPRGRKQTAGKRDLGASIPAKDRHHVSAAPVPDCDPNFFLDALGEKHFKPECFLEKATGEGR